MTYRRHKYGLGIRYRDIACANLKLSIRQHHQISSRSSKGIFVCKEGIKIDGPY